jgi:hypothetical protein
MLVAYSMASTHVQTTRDYLLSFQKYSDYQVEYLHVTHEPKIEFSFDAYDVVFHNYCARLCFEGYVSQSYRDRLRAFRGVKILAVQDEYDRTDMIRAAISDLGFDIVLTCVPQDSLDYVYPRADFPGVDFVTVFTGYVPDEFAAAQPKLKPLAERPIFIGYRGRDIGARYGRLAFEKFEIGRRMREICDARGIATDIATDEASRIYGPAWLDFVGDCRAMLGSESGSNVFDFDGKIEKTYKTKTLANFGRPPSYAEFENVIARRESEIDVGQISPRVFECAVMRTPMVLFKGRYSDAVRADEHYISLEKDFSNVEAVIARLEDIDGLEAMTGRAYDRLVGSGLFGYRAFVRAISERIEARAARSSAADQGPAPGAAKAPRQAGAPASGASPLVELPTRAPKSMADFRLQQRLLHGPTFARSAQKVDAILMRSLNDSRKALRGLARLREWTAYALFLRPTRPDLERQDEPAPNSVEQFVCACERTSQERSDYFKRRQALDAALTSAGREATQSMQVEILSLDENWVVRLNSLHRGAMGLYYVAFAELEAQVRALAPSGAPRASARRLVARPVALFAATAVAAIRFNAAKINFIKQIVDRSPAARALAFRLLALLRR